MDAQPKLKWFDDYRDRLKSIDAEVDASLTSLLESVTPKERNGILERIRSRRDKISLSSSSTDRVLGVCGQILGFGAAGLALSVGFADKVKAFDPVVQKLIVSAGILYGELVLVSIVVLLLYVIQARFRYPFLYFEKIGNAWPWFYYSAISRDVPRRAIQTPEELYSAATKYADDFRGFASKVVHENELDQLRNEIQQYYLLIAYQGYAHQFALDLTNVFLYGLMGVSGSALFLLVLVLFL